MIRVIGQRIGQARVWARGVVIGTVALGVGLGAWTSVEAQSLRWLGTLGGTWSRAWGVSADGSVVVGDSQLVPLGPRTGFRWTAETGMQPIIVPGMRESAARFVSADGSILVGWVFTDSSLTTTYRWTERNGYQFAPVQGHVFGITPDGSRVFLYYGNRYYRWEPANLQQIPIDLTGLLNFTPRATSSDGSVIVGQVRTTSYNDWAAVWTEGAGFQFLNSFFVSGGQSVSADGRIIVGQYSFGHHQSSRIYYWNLQREPLNIDIGDSPVISPNGQIVYFTKIDSGNRTLFRWSNLGVQDLRQVYPHFFVNGSRLVEASAISPNGRYIVGLGYNAATGRTEAFLLDVKLAQDVDGSGCVDLADVWYIIFRVINGVGCPECDVNGDGRVDLLDAQAVLNYLNDPTTPKCWR